VPDRKRARVQLAQPPCHKSKLSAPLWDDGSKGHLLFRYTPLPPPAWPMRRTRRVSRRLGDDGVGGAPEGGNRASIRFERRWTRCSGFQG